MVSHRSAAGGQTLKLGIPAYWGELVPPLQNSAYGGVVLENEFEPLVRRGNNGLMEPLAARSWTISADHRTVRFKIDTSRRFSDGSPLTAMDFKRSWENGLRMKARARNRSVEDALYNLKGFAQFARKGTIEGIKAPSDDTLELEFLEPARVPLGYLSGVRYAVYRKAGPHFIGTGPYAMRERDKTLLLTPNPHFADQRPRFRRVEIGVVPSESIAGALAAGAIDGALFAEKSEIPGCEEKSARIRCAFSQESDHVAIQVNGLEGRLFHKPEYRLALQALIHERLRESGPPEPLKAGHFRLDPQSFLRFQAGRLSDAEAEQLIERGKRYIPALQAASRRRPVYIVSRGDSGWLISLLRSSGIEISKKSGQRDFAEVLRMSYQTHEADLILGMFSVYNGDPDGLYHLLGRHGAIHSPMMERPMVSALMERGRGLADKSKLNAVYEEVSRHILEGVPYVHLGFNCRGVAYDSRRLAVAESFFSRNNHSVSLFEPK